jgi:hypothetical protein
MSEHIRPSGWFTSSRCSTGACVEVAFKEEGVRVRDSKNPDGPELGFDDTAWQNFLAAIRHGELDPR